MDGDPYDLRTEIYERGTAYILITIASVLWGTMGILAKLSFACI